MDNDRISVSFFSHSQPLSEPADNELEKRSTECYFVCYEYDVRRCCLHAVYSKVRQALFVGACPAATFVLFDFPVVRCIICKSSTSSSIFIGSIPGNGRSSRESNAYRNICILSEHGSVHVGS